MRPGSRGWESHGKGDCATMVPKRLALTTLAVMVVGCGAPQTMAMGRLSLPPEAYFITQYTHPRYHPETVPLYNANCGPTSLAMALEAFGKAPTNLTQNREELILAVREAMTGSRDSNSWTYPSQFPRAASKFGLQAQIVQGGAAGVLAQLAIPGRMVIVNVNPSPAYATKLTYNLDGGHFALVTGFDGDKVFLNDPLAEGPMTITRAQLETALTTPLGPGIAPYRGGISVWSR